MKSLVAVFIAMIGLAGSALPVLAQSEITVFGGRVNSYYGPRPFYNDDYVYGNNFDPGMNFDPSAAAINALNISNFFPGRGRSVFNYNRAFTLNITGESIAEHQERCQSQYASYDPISDTYLGRNGIPRPCR